MFVKIDNSTYLAASKIDKIFIYKGYDEYFIKISLVSISEAFCFERFPTKEQAQESLERLVEMITKDHDESHKTVIFNNSPE